MTHHDPNCGQHVLEVSCNETRDRSWIPMEQFAESLNDPESAIRFIERVEECECCEQSKIVHSEQEVTL